MKNYQIYLCGGMGKFGKDNFEEGNKWRTSDLVIINFNDMYSLGSMAELAIAYERKIPIVGLDINKQDLHPWEVEMCNRIFNDIHEMLDYVEDFYLR